MIRIFLITLMGLCHLVLGAQDDPVVMETVQLSNSEILICASNSLPCPVSLSMELELENLSPTEKLPEFMVIPASAKDFEVVRLTAKKPGKSMGYNYSYSYQLGDAVNSKHNDDYHYGLPFPLKETYLMSQGNNGSFSHRGKNAVDFTMPEGTEIRAAREGTVIKIKEDSNSGCKDPRCINQANQILILHEDGTIADYSHLKKKGASVDVGMKVDRGQVIGLSGNTGWSSGPHLHLEVYLYSGREKITVPIKFEVSPSEASLLEKRKYTAFE